MSNIVIFESSDQSVQVRLELAEPSATRRVVRARQVVDFTAFEKYLCYRRTYPRGNCCKKCNHSNGRWPGGAARDRILQSRRHHFRGLSGQLHPRYPLSPVATGVLREHLTQGYSLNQQRLKERGIGFQLSKLWQPGMALAE